MATRRKRLPTELGGAVHARPTMADLIRRKLVTRIMALVELLKGTQRSVRLVEYADGSLNIDDGEREPSSWHTFTPFGVVTEHSCEYSGHNGDSYGHKERVLDDLDSLRALQGINADLQRRCLAAEERRLEEAAHRARQELALSNLNARLRGMGVP